MKSWLSWNYSTLVRGGTGKPSKVTGQLIYIILGEGLWVLRGIILSQLRKLYWSFLQIPGRSQPRCQGRMRGDETIDGGGKNQLVCGLTARHFKLKLCVLAMTQVTESETSTDCSKDFGEIISRGSIVTKKCLWTFLRLKILWHV